MIKRVLHVVSAMNRGGAETLLMNVYRHIDRGSVQFDFVSHRSEVGHYDEEIESLGGKIYRIPSLGKSGPVNYVKNIMRIISKQDYIAVHAHTDFQSGFPALAAKRMGIRKIVCHAHTNRWEKRGPLYNNIVFPLLRSVIKYSATDLCACSLEAAHFLFGEKLSRSVKILKNGIDVDEYWTSNDDHDYLRKELALSKDVKILGHVGHLSPVKDQSFILKLLKRLLDEGIHAAAVFVGEGPDRQELEEKCRHLDIDGRVFFLGVRADIPQLMNAFDVFVFPSIYEGFGIVTLEAQCAGTACVVAETVPSSTDLGLGLMSFLSLDDDIQIWTDEVKRALGRGAPDKFIIKRRFSQSGYYIRESVPKWLALYGLTN